MSSFWDGKKVLVFGGTGFLGVHVCRWLLSHGAQVSVFDFREPSSLSMLDFKHIPLVIGDIRDLHAIRRAYSQQKIELVFHLAAIPTISGATAQTYEDINVKGTQNILQVSHDFGVSKIVYVSSSTVYGIPSTFPAQENDPLKPLGKYGRSKLEAEKVCLKFIDKGDAISIIRPRVIMGPGRMGIFSILFSRIKAHQPVFLIGSGQNIFQFTGVSDMVKACVLVAQSSSSDIFNIGSDDQDCVREVMMKLLHHAKSKSKLISLPPRIARLALWGLEQLKLTPLMSEQYGIADKNFKLDTSKAKRILGWIPQESNASCLISAYDWFCEHAPKGAPQYKSFFSVLGKFRKSHQSAFQK